MEREQIIIRYVLRLLADNRLTELQHRLTVLNELLGQFSSYEWDKIVGTVCWSHDWDEPEITKE